MAKQIVPCASRLESAFFTRDLSSLDWRIRGDLEKARRSMAHADSEDLSRSAGLASDRQIDDDRGGFRIRIYTPETMPRPAPGLFFFH